MMEENNGIFFSDSDALVYLAGTMHKKKFHNICLGPSIYYACILGPISQPPTPCKNMYSFSVTVTAVGLFQKILLSIITHMY